MFSPPPCQIRKGHVVGRASNGVMDATSGQVEKAGTHASSFIVMYLAVVEIHHCVVATNDKASALPNKEGKCQRG